MIDNTHFSNICPKYGPSRAVDASKGPRDDDDAIRAPEKSATDWTGAMSGHHQDWKEITIGKRPSSTGGGSAKAAKDPKAVAAVRARARFPTIKSERRNSKLDAW